MLWLLLHGEVSAGFWRKLSEVFKRMAGPCGLPTGSEQVETQTSTVSKGRNYVGTITFNVLQGV